MDALGLIMNITALSGLHIVAAHSNIGSCVVDANGAAYALGITSCLLTGTTAGATLCAFAITKTSATLNMITSPTTMTVYTLTLGSNITLAGDTSISGVNVTVIGLA